jgi:hypothetical protein
VTVTHGPFAGLEGVFVAERGADRVLILLDILGKANRITPRDVARDSVAPGGAGIPAKKPPAGSKPAGGLR